MGLLIVSTGCGGGGGGSVATTKTISGAVIEGAVKDSTVTARDSSGAVVATATSDANAKYTLSIPDTVSLPVQITASGGTDLVTGQTMTMEMSSLVIETSQSTANVSPITTLITHATKSKAGGDLSKASAADMESAKSVVLKNFGFGIDGDDATINPVTSPVTNANISAIAKASEAMGETVRRIVGTNNSKENQGKVLEYLAEDISDGKMDGLKNNSSVSAALPTGMDASTLMATTAVQTTAVLVEVVSNTLQVTKNNGDKMSADAVKTALSASITAVRADVNATTALNNLADTKISKNLKDQASAFAWSANSLAESSGSATFNSLATSLDNLVVGEKASQQVVNLSDQVKTELTNISKKQYSATQIKQALKPPPKAEPLVVKTIKDSPVSGVLPGWDHHGNPLTFLLQSGDGAAKKGKVEITNTSTGAFTYTPKGDETGVDTFIFMVTAEDLVSNPAKVTVNIAASASDASDPLALNRTVTVVSGASSAGKLEGFAPSGTRLTYTIIDQPAHGTLVLQDPATGFYTYNPTTIGETSDSFTYTVSDGTHTSKTASVQIALTKNTLSQQVVTPMADETIQTDSSTFQLKRSGANQYLLPVKVGKQVFNLLVDTGSDSLLLFQDKIKEGNTEIVQSTTAIQKSYSSGIRSGVLATAPVRIGQYATDSMHIMIIQNPDSGSDPSLTAKGADGIIGFRRTRGVDLSQGNNQLDATFNRLTPQVDMMEFNLPPTGAATITFGKMPILDRAKSQYVFRAKASAISNPYDSSGKKEYSDIQMPFQAKSSLGEINTGDLDILLDSGAVSKLVLDTSVAEALGYDSSNKTWRQADNEEIDINLVGLNGTAPILPKFKIWEASVAPYSSLGVSFKAVLGINRWQEYVVGYDFRSVMNDGPDATISLLRRLDMTDALEKTVPTMGHGFIQLPGLNSFGNDEYPSANETGSLIAFQSDRPGGKGGMDVYLWSSTSGLVDLPNLNHTGHDLHPRISGDGHFLVFQSTSLKSDATDQDIFLYDLEKKELVDTSLINSTADDAWPSISQDGRYIAFTSQRTGGSGGSDIYLYDRTTAQFVDLTGVNSAKDELSPDIRADG
ncbi:MAG: PD40 domain-containing protein, partial [Magnetococcales bacterium]|nr:PD40 domain-containing protein [Magnetococcales bacterium]